MDLNLAKSLHNIACEIEKEIHNFNEKKDDYENKIQKLNNTISKLKTIKKILEFKMSFYSEIIKNNTNINITDLIKEKDDGLHIYNYEKGNIPVFVHNYINGDEVEEIPKEYSIKIKKHTQDKKPVFRSFVEKEKLICENPKEEQDKIKKVEEKFQEIIIENFDVSKKEISSNIEKIMDEIKKCRVIKKSYLASIQENRCKLLGKLNLEDYIAAIKLDTNKLKSILNEKKIIDKKIISNLTASLSPLEQRLICYDKYYDSSLIPEEIQKLKLALQINMSYDKRYIPFLYSYLTERLHNYGISIFPVKEILEIVLVNPFKFSNVIYLNINKETDKDDPYTFYILENIKDDGKRNWKMNNRLIDFSKQLSDIIKTYCVQLFRKIYFTVFNDNIYRDDYMGKAIIFQQDCEQLLHNLIFISNQKSFCNFVRNLISKNHCIESTALDKFNFKSDDSTAKKSFHKEKDKMLLIVSNFFLMNVQKMI